MDGLNDQTRVLADVSRRLDSLGLEWMLTGALASAYHAEPRMTSDIDLVVDLDTVRPDTIEQAFEAEYYIPEQGLREGLETGTMFSLLHIETGIKVDFVPVRETAFQQAAMARRQQIALYGNPVWLISLEDLVVAKLVWAKDTGSELQLRDIRGLLAKPHDRGYIESWVGRLGLRTIWHTATKFEK